MPLTWLLVVALGGIVLIVATVHALGGTVQGSVGDEDTVRARYRREVVGSDPGDVVVDREQRSALVWDPELGPVAVVAVGDGVVTRPLGPRAQVRLAGEDTLAVEPHDLLLGPFELASPEAAAWVSRLSFVASTGG